MGATGLLGGLFLTLRWCRPMWDSMGAEAFAKTYRTAIGEVLADAGARRRGRRSFL